MERIEQISEGQGWGDQRRLAEERICIYAQPLDTDEDVVKPWRGWGLSGGGRSRGKWTSVIASTIRNKKILFVLRLPRKRGLLWLWSEAHPHGL